jgi:hypothetical protein
MMQNPLVMGRCGWFDIEGASFIKNRLADFLKVAAKIATR